MNEKVPCAECGAAILPGTAERTGGLCMPCKNGNRKNIEQAKAYYRRERELDKTCPFRALWRELVDKVYNREGGFSQLTDDEKLYYAVNVLIGEVYNGGFNQYFDNSAGGHYRHAELGLIQLGATHSLELLRQAKATLFGAADVPGNRAERFAALDQIAEPPNLKALNDQFYEDPDALEDKLRAFAEAAGLLRHD
ncbi:DMP19 family protein [Marinobacter daepoensis]|uniref:DMP19 family protein n=1 Tax=Marinobacter daepoensis TaxID=262077 RepID=UPI001C940969|nr:DUF4375 domain-containing protein [Marinobacter daepoensis]MBY6031566.1 DMP19 family protein [Marinobacter daepoensis]